MSENANERTALDDLLRSDGWRLFEKVQTEYWRDTMTDHVAACANDTDDTAALNKLRQVVAAQQAVARVLAWPKERLRLLTPAPARETVALSRGGV